MTTFGEITIPDGVDPKKAERLIKWLIKTEDDNDKTHSRNDAEMVQKIGKQIKDEAKCL